MQNLIVFDYGNSQVKLEGMEPEMKKAIPHF
jgi:hypothetical protein